MINNTNDRFLFSSLQNMNEDLDLIEMNLLKNSLSTGIEHQENYFEEDIMFDNYDFNIHRNFD